MRVIVSRGKYGSINVTRRVEPQHSRMDSNDANEYTTNANTAEQTRRSTRLSRHREQTNRVESDGSLRKKKQTRANKRSKRRDVATEKDPTVREKSRKHFCKDCNREFIQKCTLVAHSRVHSGEKPFKCDECDRCFTSKWNLTVHMRIHSGAKPFECRICNLAFRCKQHLSRHLMIHGDKRPFICDICNKSFREKAAISDHMTRHSGNRPYKCNVCQKTFGRKTSFSRHGKVHAKKDE